MKFSLNADGASAAGQGLGNMFKAMAMGGMYRNKAEDEALLNTAKMNAYRATADKNQASAALDQQQLTYQQDPLSNAMLSLGLPTGLAPAFKQRLETGSFGPSYDAPSDALGGGPKQPDPATPETVRKLGEAMSVFQRVIATGSKVDQGAKAALDEQTARFRDQAAANVGNLDLMNRLNTLTKEGATYTPFDAVGTTGVGMNKVTGQGVTIDAGLLKLFGDKNAAEAMRDKGAAANSSASGALDRERLTILKLTGALPGTGGSGEDATNAKDRNAVVAAVERELGAMAPDAEIQAEVDRRMARRGTNKNPPPAAGQPKIQLPQGYTSDRALSEAKAAIAAGKDRSAVLQRLRDMGVEPKGL